MTYKQAQKNKQKEIKNLNMHEVKFAFASGINGDVKRQKFWKWKSLNRRLSFVEVVE